MVVVLFLFSSKVYVFINDARFDRIKTLGKYTERFESNLCKMVINSKFQFSNKMSAILFEFFFLSNLVHIRIRYHYQWYVNSILIAIYGKRAFCTRFALWQTQFAFDAFDWIIFKVFNVPDKLNETTRSFVFLLDKTTDES